MPRTPKVAHVRNSFVASIESAERLCDAVKRLGAIHPNTPGPRLHTEHVRRVVELAFLGVTASWEEFLEQTFVRYLAGARSDSGFQPTMRAGQCKSLAHAYQVFSGDPDHKPEKRYLSWTDPNSVVKSAKVFFKAGNPYSNALDLFRDELGRAVKLRNRVAHRSTKAGRQFKVAAEHYHGGALHQGYAVGDLLCEEQSRGFGGLPPVAAGDPPRTYFEAHMEMYRVLASKIVP